MANSDGHSKTKTKSTISTTKTDIDFITGPNEMPFVHINCNGHRYQIKKEVYSKLNNSALKNADVYYDPTLKQEVYFIPRSGVGFDAILNYFDNGELHMPPSVCPLVFERELHLWGLNNSALAPCCQIKMTDFKEQQIQLKSIIEFFHPDIQPKTRRVSVLQKCRQSSWLIFSTTRWKDATPWARVILVIKVLAILLFMFESIISSLPYFQERMSHQGVADYINNYETHLRSLCAEHDHSGLGDGMLRICQILKDTPQDVSKREVVLSSPNIITTQQVNKPRKRRHRSKLSRTIRKDMIEDLHEIPHKPLTTSGNDNKTKTNISVFANYSVRANTTLEKESYHHINAQFRFTNVTHRRNNKPIRFNRFVKRTMTSLLSGVNGIISRNKTKSLENTPKIVTKRDVGINQTIHLFLYKEVQWLETIDLAVFLYFSFEFLIGIICSPVRWKYAFGFYGLIDLIYLCAAGFLHVYIDLIYPERKYLRTQIDVFIAFESMKVFKLFMFVQHLNSFKVLVQAISKNTKYIVHLLIYMTMWMLVISFFMYELERETMKTVPNALYWTIITVSTVGYGDIGPTTSIGKFISSITAISGIIWMAFLVPIFVEDFVLFHRYSKRDPLDNKNIQVQVIKSQSKRIPSTAPLLLLDDPLPSVPSKIIQKN